MLTTNWAKRRLRGEHFEERRPEEVPHELSKRVVERPVSVPDLFATVFAALGIDPLRELYAGDRPVPITDMGQPIAELFS